MKNIFRVFLIIFVVSGFFIAPCYGGFFEDIKERIPKEVGKSRSRGLDNKTIVKGLKEALTVSTKKAVKSVSKKGGYFKNPKIKIPVPEKIKKTAKTLRKAGLGKYVDEFTLTMNRAAEAAGPKAANIFVGAVKEMSFKDARSILKGDDTAATVYFRDKTSGKIAGEFRPIVSKEMDNVGTTRSFKKMMKRYKKLPFVPKSRAVDLDQYVTEKAVEGLFFMLGEEERKIRKDPRARVTDILKKVFKDSK